MTTPLSEFVEPGDIVTDSSNEGMCIDVPHDRYCSEPDREWVACSGGVRCGMGSFSKGKITRYSYTTLCRVPPEVALSRLRNGVTDLDKCRRDPIQSHDDINSLRTSIQRRSALKDGNYKIRARGTNLYLHLENSGSLKLIPGSGCASVATVSVVSSLVYEDDMEDVINCLTPMDVFSQLLRHIGVNVRTRKEDPEMTIHTVPDKITIRIGNRVVGVPVKLPTDAISNILILLAMVTIFTIYPPVSLGRLLIMLTPIVFTTCYLLLSLFEFIQKTLTHTTDILQTLDTSLLVSCCFRYQSDGRLISSTSDRWHCCFDRGPNPSLTISTLRIGNAFDFVPAST